jgi:hypothetical protein
VARPPPNGASGGATGGQLAKVEGWVFGFFFFFEKKIEIKLKINVVFSEKSCLFPLE